MVSLILLLSFFSLSKTIKNKTLSLFFNIHIIKIKMSNAQKENYAFYSFLSCINENIYHVRNVNNVRCHMEQIILYKKNILIMWM